MKLSFKNIKNDLFAPGNIFWQKSSGATLLLNQKGEALNLPLIKKLDEAGMELVIEDGIDFHFHAEIKAVYEKYTEELLMREKIIWRDKLIELLVKEFASAENVMQFEVNYLAWNLFSSFKFEEGMNFIARDSDLFQRNLSVASSYTFCAFLLGYYESNFLSRLFNSTLKNLMELGATERVMSLKEKLEYLRLQESFSVEDFEYVKGIASSEILSQTVLFEKYDGTGPRSLNSREMSDLDVAFVALSGLFSFTESSPPNILWVIQHGKFVCRPRVFKLLSGALKKAEDRLANVAA